MLTLRHLIPLFGLILAAACNDDEGLGDQCLITHHEALPAKVSAYNHALAVDGEGRVHVAGASVHLVRAPDGSWSSEEDAFGASYFGEVVLASSGPSVVVAHTADGLRVARGGSGSWATLFELSSNQCSGHPYVDRVEAADDGSVLFQSSEGLLRIREGSDPEWLPYAEAWTVDGDGLLTCNTGDELLIADRAVEVTLPHKLSRVLGMATSPRGGAAILLAHDHVGGVWLARRNEKGAWDSELTELAAWTDVECPDDPESGMTCSPRTTRADVGQVVSAGGSLLAFIVLRHGRAELRWDRAPVVGSPEFWYWSWQGDWTYEHELWMGDLAAEEPVLRRVTLPEEWDMEDAYPTAAPGPDGFVYALFGSSYARIGCPK